jgi:L-seryl-tRNA(Ser) seleniumtransferase
MANSQDELRRLPAVEKLLGTALAASLARSAGRDLLLEAVRTTLDALRREVLSGTPYPGDEELWQRIQAHLQAILRPTLQEVINATGIILHTNLGRAPLSASVLEAMRLAGESYSNLEYDLQAGQRGSRYVHAEALLCRLTGAEAALLVNNNAGAVLLALSALAREREVIISRGQLVEIGGGFRIPDVLAQSGARLVEIGTTNRTYHSDYAAAITPATAALLRVHASNFRILGFTHEAALAELVSLAHEHGVLVLDDLGSGTLLDTAPFGLAHEPTIQESVAQGADIVTFSGDKLLGGPQAGVIVGRRELIARLRQHPLTRALRVDKTTLAGIQANLLHYVQGEALQKIPIWQMISLPPVEIAARARALVDACGPLGTRAELISGHSMIGGGSLPEESLPTTLMALSVGAQAAAWLRAGTPPVVARMQDERLLLDLRTVFPAQEPILAARLRALPL